jgi:hypothetical protein
MIVGSASAATATSRLEPMPPNALPASRPARARKKVPRTKRYMRSTRPAKSRTGRASNRGTMRDATTMVENST